jgi:ligand-binding SRPBCC domain-containing protein
MTVHTLHREQVVKTSLEAAWEFVRNPANLNLITPADLEFEIVSPVPEAMADGLLIEYRITIPWLGRRVWVTEIKHVRHQESFVDEQRVGPYRFWYHFHELRRIGDSVRLTDRVTYRLPWGWMAGPVHRLYVRPSLERIFDFREQEIGNLLSGH